MDLTFTADDIEDQRNRFAPIDGRMLPKPGNGFDKRARTCTRCGARSWPYSTCAWHRELGTVHRVLRQLEDEGTVVRLEDGRGRKGGARWKIAPKVPYVRATPKLGRNDPCSCGSGKKYKHCCINPKLASPQETR